MARPRQRVRLEDGLKLDLNKLLREGFWPRGNSALIAATTSPWVIHHRGLHVRFVPVVHGNSFGSLERYLALLAMALVSWRGLLHALATR